MHPGQARLITLCQQLLVVAAVFAVLIPAASVVSMDIVDAPAAPVASAGQGERSEVETQAVDAEISEIPLTGATEAAGAAGASGKSSAPLGRVAGKQTTGSPAGGQKVLSQPEPVTGYGAVGVTWGRAARLGDRDISVQVRTLTDGVWSGWTDLTYKEEHGPDPDSPEGEHARPGTEPLFVGHVDQVQVRAATTKRPIPADLTLAIIAPGESAGTAEQAPAIDTGALPSASGEGASGDGAGQSVGEDAAELQTTTVTSKPLIYSRAQWGADESQRDASALHYYEVHAAFVHHTVNANDYTRAEVPGILRSIYAYHTRSRGWSDIGYNYLVDRFGRVWEGRYGGVDRPVVGAHTLGYNDYAFAASAIGNYEIERPSSAMVDAFGKLIAWKLSLHGVSAGSTLQRVGSRNFQAINGHQDAASTACPGKYLYAQLPTIRRIAAAAQADWSGRELDRNVVGTAYPDLVMRRASDKQLVVLPTGGVFRMTKGVAVGSGWGGYEVVVGSPDLTGDRRADVVTRAARGVTRIHPGDGRGGFGAGKSVKRKLRGLKLITAAGDLDRDGRNDLAGVRATDGRLVVLMGRSGAKLKRRVLGTNLAGVDLLAGVGDITGDGRSDLLARTGSGRLLLYAAGRFDAPRTVPGSWKSVETMTGIGDYTRDGRPDVLMRTTKGKGFVLPSTGSGTFGRLVGPFGKIKGFTDFSGAGQIAGAGTPDLVGRVGDRLVVVRSRGTTNTLPLIATGIDGSALNAALIVGDWDRDGYGDLVTRTTAGVLQLRLGNGTGRFRAPTTLHSGFASVSLLSAVGDITGDGYPDLMGQVSGSGMRIWAGRGAAGLSGGTPAAAAMTASRQLGGGRWDADGSPDSLFQVGNSLVLRRGNGPGGLTGAPVTLGFDLSPYDWVGTAPGLKGSGHTVLLVRTRGTGELRAIKTDGVRFGKPKLLATGLAGYDLMG